MRRQRRAAMLRAATASRSGESRSQMLPTEATGREPCSPGKASCSMSRQRLRVLMWDEPADEMPLIEWGHAPLSSTLHAREP